MNSVIVLPEEVEGSCAIIRQARALYLYDTHELREGLRCRASLYGGKRGESLVRSAQRDLVELELFLDRDPLPRSNCVLITAIARPQTIKKVVQLAATIGVVELHFLQTANTEKSYLQSKALKEVELRDEMIKGLEQSFDSIPPQVEVHPQYWRFKKYVMPVLQAKCPGARRYILHTAADTKIEIAPLESGQCVFLALGPESGWSEDEFADFKTLGFESLSLGDRIMRVEHALAFALSRVEYVRPRAHD